MNKPPVLSEEEIAESKRGHTAIIYKDGRPPDVWEQDYAIAQAQLDADIKWFVKRLSKIHKDPNYKDESIAIRLFIKELKAMVKEAK